MFELGGIKTVTRIFDPADYRALESENTYLHSLCWVEFAPMLDRVAEHFTKRITDGLSHLGRHVSFEFGQQLLQRRQRATVAGNAQFYPFRPSREDLDLARGATAEHGFHRGTQFLPTKRTDQKIADAVTQRADSGSWSSALHYQERLYIGMLMTQR